MTKRKDIRTKDTKGRNLYQGESQMPDGRYRFRYIDRFGQRKAIYSWRLVTTDRMPEGKRMDKPLREKETQILRDLEDGINVNAQSMTLNELLSRYLDTKVSITPSTKENYVFIWNKDIKDNALGFMKIKDIKKSDILKFYAHLYKERKLGRGTIQLFQNFLYPAFQMAVEDSIIRLNPCKGCMKDYSGAEVSDAKKPLTKTEEQNLLMFLKEGASFYRPHYTLVAFMLWSGVRIGEALGLTWKDVDFEKETISINHQLIYKKKDGKIQPYISGPKNKLAREIPMTRALLKLLSEHKRETYMISRYGGYSLNGYSEFVFLNREGKVHKPETIVRAFHGMVNQYNKENAEKGEFLPDFTPHILRHTFCTRMAENGMDVKVLQTIMGHKNIGITMQVYNHVNTDRAQNEMKRIEEAMSVS